MKRERDNKQLLFSALPINQLEASLAMYLQSQIAQSARFDETSGKYIITKAGAEVQCCGLVQTLRFMYYPHYQDNRSKRNWKKTQIKGSSASLGKKIDLQLAQSITETLKRPHGMTLSLLNYFKKNGHVIQAAQVPVEVSVGLLKVTQADIITMDIKSGNLWLYEVKSGFPVGFSRKQGCFKGKLSHVECTKKNIWQLQLEYTRRSLEAVGVKIFKACVIQVYEKKGVDGYIVTIHEQPKWIKDL